jgi:hypothetical protein
VNKSRIIGLALSISFFIGVYFLIPINIYDRHTIFYGFVGSIGVFGGLFQFAGNFKSLSSAFESKKDRHQSDENPVLAGLMVIPAFIILFWSIFYHSSRVESNIKSNPKFARGVIVNGESKTSTRKLQTHTSYELYIVFKDTSGKNVYFTESVSSSEFQNTYKGASIELVYSAEYPELAKTISSLKEIKKYKESSEALSIDNLKTILDNNMSGKLLEDYLNTSCMFWKMTEEDTTQFENKLLKATLVTKDIDDQLIYINSDAAFLANEFEYDFIEKAAQSGFVQDTTKTVKSEGQKIKFYFNEPYKLIHINRTITVDTKVFLKIEKEDIFILSKSSTN